MDLQAMARAHRIGQKFEVRVLRLITASPIEEKILATANEKLDQEAKIIEAGKFNQTSDASERRETLQKLLAQSADGGDDEGNEIPTDEEINEMLARPNPTLNLTREEEVSRLNQMDAERVAREVAKANGGKGGGSKGGGGGGAPARLLSEAELPEWLYEAELLAKEREAAGDEPAALDGPRERTKQSYGDVLGERDFTRWTQSGLEMDAWIAQEAERKRKLEDKAAGGAGGSSAEAASPAELPSQKKGPGRPKKAKTE